MKLMAIGVLGVSLVLISYNASAEQSFTAKQLYNSCYALTGDYSSSNADANSKFCMGYFSAVIDSFIAYDSLGSLPSVMRCVPSGISTADAVGVFMLYLQGNQGQLNDPAIATVLKAFSEEYPPTC